MAMLQSINTKKGTRMNEGGKGDKPRPLAVSQEQFDKNFDAIFGKKDKEPIPFAGMVDVELTNDEKEISYNYTVRF